MGHTAVCIPRPSAWSMIRRGRLVTSATYILLALICREGMPIMLAQEASHRERIHRSDTSITFRTDQECGRCWGSGKSYLECGRPIQLSNFAHMLRLQTPPECPQMTCAARWWRKLHPETSGRKSADQLILVLPGGVVNRKKECLGLHRTQQ